MPTPNYNTGLIYKLVHKEDYDNKNIYIGSTTNFTKRKDSHKSCYNLSTKKAYNQLKYVYMRDNGGWNMWDMMGWVKF